MDRYSFLVTRHCHAIIGAGMCKDDKGPWVDADESEARIAELEKDVTDMDEAHSLHSHRIDALEAMLERTAQALDSCARTGMSSWPLELAEEARALLKAGRE